MKTVRNIAILILAVALGTAGCDKNQSGPTQPSADEPTPETAETAEKPDDDSEVTPPSRGPLYETGGPSAPVKVGESAEVALTIAPADGFKINKLFDWNFEFHPSDDVALKSNEISSDDVQLEDSGATIPVDVTAKKAGEHELRATGNFSVCNDAKCELYRDQQVTFRLSATDG